MYYIVHGLNLIQIETQPAYINFLLPADKFSSNFDILNSAGRVHVDRFHRFIYNRSFCSLVAPHEINIYSIKCRITLYKGIRIQAPPPPKVRRSKCQFQPWSMITFEATVVGSKLKPRSDGKII